MIISSHKTASLFIRQIQIFFHPLFLSVVHFPWFEARRAARASKCQRCRQKFCMKWPLHLLALSLFEIRRYLNELSNILIIKAINTLLLLAEVNVSFYSKLSCRSQNRKTDFNTLTIGDPFLILSNNNPN